MSKIVGSLRLGPVFECADDASWIAGDDDLRGYVVRDDRAGSDDSASTDRYALEHDCASSDPCIVFDTNRAVVKIDVPWMPMLVDVAEVGMPCLGVERMSLIVDDIDIVRNQNAIADFDRRPGPNATAFADVTPVSDADLPAVGKDE